MGQLFFDQYSLLHFSVGVVSYFWGFSLLIGLVLHTLFEIIGNTPQGVRFINENLAGIWPGGKPYADSFGNILGDTFFFVVGMIAAAQLDAFGKLRAWY